MTKRCSTCLQELPISEFYPDKHGRHGRRNVCKTCGNQAAKKWAQANAARCSEIRKVSKAGKHRYYNATTRHGISIETYQRMMEEQESKCGICHKDISEDPNVDHCHRTGKIRGLLCRRCNGGLGSLDDSVDRLKAAIAYLEKHG